MIKVGIEPPCVTRARMGIVTINPGVHPGVYIVSDGVFTWVETWTLRDVGLLVAVEMR